MNDLALGHSTMYVTMRNLIQYMGDMALMQKNICENRHFFKIFKMIFWDLWSPDRTPYPTTDGL